MLRLVKSSLDIKKEAVRNNAAFGHIHLPVGRACAEDVSFIRALFEYIVHVAICNQQPHPIRISREVIPGRHSRRQRELLGQKRKVVARVGIEQL